MIRLPGLDRLWDALPEARIAGGAVRDCLAGQPVNDVDFASPLPPDQLIARLQDAGIKTVPTGLAHGTVTAIIGGKGFEITTLRRDIATDGRHAQVMFTDDWQEDASRRDFTINAMSADRAGQVFDYFGGEQDLAAGRVTFVGDAATRIAEDYLRILRFFRFFARYGKAPPDAAAIAAITQASAGLQNLSAERLWSEIKLLFRAAEPRPALALMQTTGVLAHLFPRADLTPLNNLVARRAPADPLLRTAALLAEDPATFAARMRLSGAEAARLIALRQPATLRPASDDADIRRALANDPVDILIGQTWLAQDTTPAWPELRTRIAATHRPVFPLQGRDLTARGIPSGPQVGQILAQLRQWWQAGGCTASAQECLEEGVRKNYFL